MLFHIIGIKETKDRKYNIDILIKGTSQDFVKTFLQEHNIIILNITEYKKTIKDFGDLKIVVLYNKQEVEIFSYLSDIKAALFIFSMIGFKVKYINFTNENKLSSAQIDSLLVKNQKKVDDILAQAKQVASQKKEKERKIYKDEKLEKTLKIAQDAFGHIDSLLKKAGDYVSKDKIRDIKVMREELTKLKMGRNDDKMSELLEKIYDKANEIEQEYLDYMQKNTTYPIASSQVTNIDIIAEYQKLQKAKKIKEIGAKRDKDDNYYLAFETTGLYIKFLLKDLKYKIHDISKFIQHLFEYIELSALFIIITISLVLWFKKISYSLDVNLYNYVFLLKTAIFGLSIFCIKKLKKQKIYTNLILLAIAISVSILLVWIIKFNFSI